MKRIFALFLICVVLLCCAGCDTYNAAKKYPHFKAPDWYCEELDFAIHYEYHEDGRLIVEAYPLRCNDTTLNVHIVFNSSYWDIFIEEDGDGITSQEEILLSGTWKYRGKKLILSVNKDILLDGQYQELVFVPMDTD